MTDQANGPTLEEQIADELEYFETHAMVHGEVDQMSAEKLASLRELQSIRNQPVPVEPKEFPHVPAAYINAIAEGGDKHEAIEFLQKTWNELCAIRQYTNDLQSALKVAQQDCWNLTEKVIPNIRERQ